MNQMRHLSLVSMLAVGLAAQSDGQADAAWRQQRLAAAAKTRRIIMNDDGARAYVKAMGYSWEEHTVSGAPVSSEEFGRIIVEPLLDKQFDTLFLSLMDATVFPTRMTNPEDMVGGDPARPLEEFIAELPEVARPWARLYIPQARRLWQEDSDDLEAAIREGHRHGMEVWASIRMNDLHFTGEDCLIEWSPFSRAHPELNVSGPRSALDYEHPEVREYRLRHVRDVVRFHPELDGLELDFTRFPVLFKTRNVFYERPPQADLFTEFVGQIRQILDEAGQRRGRPILLSAQTLPSLETSLSIGLDVQEWLDRGYLDLLVPGGGYTIMDRPVEGIVKAAEQAAVPVYFNVANYTRADAVLWASAANAYRKGADGLYLYNTFPPDTDREVYRLMGDRANLPGHSKLFDAQHRFINAPWHADAWIHRESLPLPLDLTAGHAACRILVSDGLGQDSPTGPPRASLRLTIAGLGELPLAVRINGHELTDTQVDKDTPTQRDLAEWGCPLDGIADMSMGKVLVPTHEYVVPVESLRDGYNDIELTVPFAFFEGFGYWKRPTIVLHGASLLLDYSAG